ncbi:Protein kinase-like domain-containing protein [Cynara cardunculus var. scolymus]|uniref:Protein kinase-like domain-containing protein n=1 Tax=Cynara cardunculus var. scolymus TaxID=59895 RepID=A0A103XZ43_CYNCS|nr:Protein kinase-like domain-containing protein [Cynara cardunculus var. scolymus]
MNFFLLLCLLILPSLSLSTNSTSCPIDFNYVNTFPWDTSACTATATATQNCCQTLRGLIGIGLADHLKKTSTFFLPNLQSSNSCLSDFQSHLSSVDVRQPFSDCLTTASEFVANPLNCAEIVTLSDWVKYAGPTTTLDSTCDEDLTGFLRCSSCLDAGMAVNARLVSLSQNSTKCFTFTALYVAGIVSSLGPEDIQTADCVLGIPLLKSRSNKRSKKTTIFAISGASVGVIMFLVVIFVYRKRNNNREQTAFHRDYVQNIRHRNLLPLRGFCATSNPMNGNEQFLVYNYMPNGSLHDHIFNKTTSNRRLSWPQRKSIILDGYLICTTGSNPLYFIAI